MSIQLVSRPIRRQDEFLERASFLEKKPAKKFKCNCKKCLLETFPIVQWLSEYQIKRDLPMDILAGITVTVLQIPQGLAYAFLANIPSIYGLYTAFFPTIIYVIFGTSRHINLGTFAVICLMVGQTITRVSLLDENGMKLKENEEIPKNVDAYKNTEVLSAITFTVSMYLLLMYCLRLGIIVSILSETLLNAFTTACAIHVFVSQLKDLFGIVIPVLSDYFTVGFTLYEIAIRLPKTNLIDLAISAVSVSTVILNNLLLKPLVSKKCRFPIPIELLVISLATIISYLVDLRSRYDVALIGDIPTGLPWPVLPNFKIIPLVAFDCFIIALVTYIITMSMGFIFARKDSYFISPNQELLALGLMDLVGSFFHCVPVSASLSRSVVQYTVGGVSALTLFVSSLFILLVLLWAGPLLEYLPKCVLASIIVSAIYTLFFEARHLKKFWLLSKLDAMIWLITFFGTVLINIRIGLIMGVASAIVVICYHSFKPNSYLLGLIPKTEIYMNKDRYNQAEEINELKIFRYEGGINFASKNVFKSQLFEKTTINAKQMVINRRRDLRKLKQGDTLPPLETPIKCIILDFSAVTHIDPAGVKTLRNLEKDNEVVGITLLISNASGEICEKLRNYDLIEKQGHVFTIFPTIHDAVLYAKQFVFTKNTN